MSIVLNSVQNWGGFRTDIFAYLSKGILQKTHWKPKKHPITRQNTLKQLNKLRAFAACWVYNCHVPNNEVATNWKDVLEQCCVSVCRNCFYLVNFGVQKQNLKEKKWKFGLYLLRSSLLAARGYLGRVKSWTYVVRSRDREEKETSLSRCVETPFN